VEKRGFSGVFGDVPQGYPENEIVSFSITWTEFPVDLRIFVGVLGERDAVYEICKHLV
jgi:hypothetical protein